MKSFRVNYDKTVLRKVYSKKGTNSLILNIPLKFAENENIKTGDYVKVTNTDEGIIIKKIEVTNER